MNKLSYLMCVAACLSCINANAHTNLTIQVFNNTDAPCQLIQKQLIHGNFIRDYTTLTLAPKESQEIHLQENSFYGPDIQLGYDCGPNKMVTFEVQQDHYMMDLPPNNRPNLSIIQITELTLAPSFFDKMPGIINLIINNK